MTMCVVFNAKCSSAAKTPVKWFELFCCRGRTFGYAVQLERRSLVDVQPSKHNVVREMSTLFHCRWPMVEGVESWHQLAVSIHMVLMADHGCMHCLSTHEQFLKCQCIQQERLTMKCL